MKPIFKYSFFAICIFYGVLFFLCKDIPFFQDNILFSAKTPMHFFKNGFFNFPLPTNIDTGYPPLWAWLVALSWQILGQQLWVGHLLCLPILMATAWFYLKIAAYFLPEQYGWFAALFLILEPTYLAQSTMVGPDIFMMMAFMGGLYSIIYHKPYCLVLMTIILSMTSVRGVIFVLTLFANHLVFNYYQHNKLYWKTILPYTFSGILFLGWMLFHDQKTGFFLVTNQSPWVGHHQLANFRFFCVNIVLTAWRMIDFGRILLYAFLIVGFVQLLHHKKHLIKKEKILLWWALAPLVILVIILCLRTNPILHRYFMVYFLLHGLCLGVFLFKGYFSVNKKIALVIISLSLAGGHLWIYPDSQPQGWDASLAHLPYFKLRSQMIAFIEQENIAYNEVMTAFPNVNGLHYTNLSKQIWNFTPKHKRPLLQCKYIIQSNVMNDFFVEELEILSSTQFKKVKRYEKMGVYMILYEKR